jgi:hypothetical protein
MDIIFDLSVTFCGTTYRPLSELLAIFTYRVLSFLKFRSEYLSLFKSTQDGLEGPIAGIN